MTEDEHLDLDTLADYGEGLLDRERTRAVRAHLAGCASCRTGVQQVADVSRALSGTPEPPIPEGIATRIDQALAQAQRDREVVPLSRTASKRRPLLLAGVAASVAAVLVGGVVSVRVLQETGGGVQVAGADGGAGSEAAPQSVAPSSATASVRVSGREYSSGRLPGQVSQLLDEEGKDSGVSVQAAEPTPDRLRPLASPTALARCVSQVTHRGAGDLLVVDLASYSGKPSAVIVATDSRPRRADVWVVDPSCAVRTHTEVTRSGRE